MAAALLGLALLLVSVTYLKAAFSTVVTNVPVGFFDNTQKVVHYDGTYFYAFYEKNNTNLYWKSSADGWVTENTLTPSGRAVAGGEGWNIWWENDTTGVLMVGNEAATSVTFHKITIGAGPTMTLSGAETRVDSGCISHMAVTMAGGTLFGARPRCGNYSLYKRNQPGLPDGTGTYTAQIGGPGNETAEPFALLPFSTAKILIVREENPGGTGNDGWMSYTWDGTTIGSQMNVFDHAASILSNRGAGGVTISDTDFRVVLATDGVTAGKLTQWTYNGTSWSSTVIDSTNTCYTHPTLMRDRISGDLYAFASASCEANTPIYRYKNTGGSSWGTRTLADESEGTARSIPVTQYSDPPPGSSRTVPRELVWGYRVANGATNYDLKVGNLNLASATTAAITGTNPASLTETNLNGATVTVTLTGGTYDASLFTTDFTLNGAPTGTTISGVVRDSATQATLTLAFDGTDFDTNVSMSVTVLQAALATGTGPVTTGTVTVTAVVELTASITGTNPASLTETNLNGATVTVTIANGTYDASLFTTDFTLNGAPAGTTISGVVRDSATQATLTLAFNGTDFDTDASMSVTVLQVALGTGTGPATTGTATVTAVVEVADFKFRNSITIDRTKVPGGCGTTLANFPMLSSVTDLDLRTTANGGDVIDVQGDDILFRALDDATCGGVGSAPCTLDHEIESYNATSGQLVAWVRIPALNTAAASSNTVIYIYYGNPLITSSIQNAGGVWDTNYVGVWHLKEEAVGTGTVGLYTDSSGNGNHGDDFISATGQTGQVNGGHDFDGVDDRAHAPSSGTLDSLGPLTVSVWVRPDTFGGGSTQVVVKNTIDAADPGYWRLELDNTVPEVSTFAFSKDHATTDLDVNSANGNITLASWQHLTATWDGTVNASGVHLFRNGSETLYGASTSGVGAPVSDAGLKLAIGANGNGTTATDGLIDEVRISNAIRSSCWIGAEFNNMNAPGDIGAPNFYTVGGEVSAPLAKVGSFTKSGAVGTQTIAHGLSEVPKAIIFWTTGKTNEAFSGSYLYGFGMTDGTTSKSVAAANLDAVGTSNASNRIANKALTIVQWGEVLVAEADLQSWDATNFTLNWTANDANAYVIHFLAVGGADVSAKVVGWTMPLATGNQPVAGVGFQPTAVIHAYGGYRVTGAPPSSAAYGGFGLGAMDADGGQWATTHYTLDASAGANTQRGQQTDAAIYSHNSSLGIVKEASFVSMDANGFTLNFTTAEATQATQVISLALKGLNIKAGNFLKSTGAQPVSQPVTGVGFRPSAVLLTSFQDVTQASPVAHSRFGIGASDGTTQGSSAFTDEDVAATTNVDAIDKTSKVFVKDNNTTSTIDAEANLTSMDTNGFTLNWTINDAVQTEILYLALGPANFTEVRLISFDATRYSGGVLVQWKTGYEIDNLGFHVYREINGVRTRVSRSLIAGSGLAAGQGQAVTAEQRYALWDLDGAAADGSVEYWLEDLDFSGKSTWHGPAKPVAGSLIAPDVPTSTALHDLGRHGKGRKVFVTHGEAGTKRGRPAGGSLPQDPIETQAGLAGQAAVKIGIRAPGWYRVTHAELLAAGVNPQVDPRTLRLFVDGAEQAIRVTGETDGRFDAGDAIEFYATGLDTPYTDTRFYWLAASNQRGQRIGVMGSAAPSAVPAALRPASFSFTLQQKERSIYFAALRNGDTENWFGSLVWEEATDLSLTLSHPDTAALEPAQLEVALQGVTSTPNVNPDHRVGVLVNGTDVGELDFDGQNRGVQSFAVPHAALREGANTITLIARGGEADYSLFDVLRLSYQHTYQADADHVRVTFDVPGPATIGGFATSAIRVVDITDPAAAVELGGAVRAEGGGFSAITVRVPGPGPRTLVAFAEGTIASPASVQANRPSHWRDATQAHDYVVITHRNFVDQATWLTTLRAQRGHRPAVVDIEDVYDEFSFGEKTPQAVKDFLRRARASWREPPKFVVLMGDATIDPRDYAGMGDADFVPTKQVAMASVALETASDDWFVDFDDDGLGDLAMGRLPVRSADQAETMVTKIERYEQASAQPWTKGVLLVADENDETANFEEYSTRLIAHVPADYTVQTLFRGSLDAQTAGQLLALRVNDGQLIVNYQGHGSVRIWGRDGSLLTPDDVTTSWRNGNRLPLVVTMNCLNGLFHGIWDEESLAETLLRAPGGGAVATWASSSVTASATQSLVNEELFRLIFQGTYATVGEAAAAAKRVVTSRDLRRSWIFFGDPALRLIGAPLPASRPTGSSSTSASVITAAVAGSEQGDRTPDAAAASRPPAEPVRLADFNGDARDDMWVHAPQSGLWAAALSSDDGVAFRIGQWTPAWQIVPAELNGDRRADLVFYNPLTGDVIQSTNTGDGTFSLSRTFASGATGGQLSTGDFNGDRRDDVLIYQPASGAWVVAIVDGRGTLVERRGAWTGGARVQVADFSGDGLADVFGYDRASGLGFLSMNQGDAQFVVTSNDWGQEWRVLVANLDGDANADLLFYNSTTGAWLECFNAGRGRFATRTGTWAAGLTVHGTDLDGDGRDDVFAYDQRTGRWMIAVNLAPGRFATESGLWTPGWTIATGDLNGDKLGDLVLYDAVTGIWFRLVTLVPGVFAESSGTWLRDGTLFGRPQ